MLLGAAGWLALVTLLGLASGLAREWLLVASWGAGARTDSFLVAVFLPEAVRTILGGGILSSAALALWQRQDMPQRGVWLGRTTFGLGVVGLLMALILSVGAPWMVHVVGPGLNASQATLTSHVLFVLAWATPAMILQALWSVPLQAHGRFLLPGLGSLIYNLPAVLYLAWHRAQATEIGLAWAFVLGAVASALVLLPSAMGEGLRMASMRWHTETLRDLWSRLLHLLASAVAGQALMLLERMVATFLGEGVVTVLNLARKLMNLPLMALMSVNQVALGLMSKGSSEGRLPLLRQGLALNTLITTPAAVGMMLAAQALVSLLFPRVEGTAMLAPVLAWYAVALVLAGWNALLARYNHAVGDTRLPFVCEMAGNVAQAIALPLLAWRWGVEGMAVAVLIGVLVNGFMLLQINRLWSQVRLPALLGASAACLILSAQLLMPALPSPALPRLVLSSGVACAVLLILALWLKPWRQQHDTP